MSLRRTFLIFAAALALIGVSVAAMLMLLTAKQHRAAYELSDTVESARVSEEIGFALAALRDASDPPGREVGEAILRRLVGDAAHFVTSVHEGATLARLTIAIDRYAVEIRDAAARGRSPAQIRDDTHFAADEAFSTARELGRVNVEQGRAMAELVARWDRLGDVIGIAAIVTFSLGLGFAAWWLQGRTLRPALTLAASIERYAAFDRNLRASEQGPAEFRTIARRFNELASTLERQRNARLAFLAGIAHDLRNPLSALKLATSMISPDQPLPSEDRVRQLFTRVQRQIDRLDRMAHDFLDAARVEAGKLELQLERCDLGELARATVELFEPAARMHPLTLDVPSERVVVSCDPVRIEQVLTNLVSNAIKYSPGGGNVRVSVAGDAGRARISVSDEGLGMSAEDAEKLFLPFQRTGPATGSIEGVGLGLFVARRIVEAHGGRISVASSAGHGSTFTVELPAGATSTGAKTHGTEGAEARPTARVGEPTREVR